MTYTAADGRVFATTGQLRKYEEWLREEGQAPGGPGHLDSIREHGHVVELRIVREGMGRHRVIARHEDGAKFTSVHPDAARAHSIGAELLELQETPSLGPFLRSKAHPTGLSEAKRISDEDKRESEERESSAGE